MRKFLAIAFGLAAFLFVTGAEQVSARGGQYRSVAVDTSRISVQGRVLASNLRSLLAERIYSQMSGRIGAGGPQLVVRVTKIRLAPVGGYSEDLYQDQLAAEVVVPGRGVLPILITLPTGTGGAWYGPNFDEKRVHALIQALAYWVAREV